MLPETTKQTSTAYALLKLGKKYPGLQSVFQERMLEEELSKNAKNLATTIAALLKSNTDLGMTNLYEPNFLDSILGKLEEQKWDSLATEKQQLFTKLESLESDTASKLKGQWKQTYLTCLLETLVEDQTTEIETKKRPDIDALINLIGNHANDTLLTKILEEDLFARMFPKTPDSIALASAPPVIDSPCSPPIAC